MRPAYQGTSWLPGIHLSDVRRRKYEDVAALGQTCWPYLKVEYPVAVAVGG